MIAPASDLPRTSLSIAPLMRTGAEAVKKRHRSSPSPTVTLTQGSPVGPSATFTRTATPTTTLSAAAQLTWPTVQQGNSGPNVYAVQYLLRHRGDGLAAEGIFGPQTEGAVKAFQQANGLADDGIVGPLTWPKLIVQVQQGSTGDAVRGVQEAMKFHDQSGGEGEPVEVDGIFGPKTDAWVRGFQTAVGAASDGIVGPITWRALVSGMLADSLVSARGRDVVVVDTAGRLHTQTNLMEELAKVRRVIAGKLEGAPHETLLVVDATTGQNGLQQARLFGEAVEVTGVALTKLDGSAKGGIAVAIAHELGLPVKLVGVGEGLDDRRPFDPGDFARALVSG